MNDELKAAAERNMSSYYNRMIAATVTHGMLIFCDHRKAHEIAREADAEIEGLRKLLACCLDEWYYEIHRPTDEAIQTAEAVKAALKKGTDDANRS